MCILYTIIQKKIDVADSVPFVERFSLTKSDKVYKIIKKEMTTVAGHHLFKKSAVLLKSKNTFFSINFLEAFVKQKWEVYIWRNIF